MLHVERFIVRAIMTNCYLAYCDETNVGVIIDPGDNSLPLLERIKELGLTIKYIINTHGHIDHIEGNPSFQTETKAPVVAHCQDSSFYERPRLNMSILTKVRSVQKPDSFVDDGDIIYLGKSIMKVIHTPGHTQGCICLLSEGNLFTGDTLFAGSIGRTDLPGGSFEQIKESLMEKIMPLGEDLRVLPGHGPASTLKAEKKTNPFL